MAVYKPSVSQHWHIIHLPICVVDILAKLRKSLINQKAITWQVLYTQSTYLCVPSRWSAHLHCFSSLHLHVLCVPSKICLCVPSRLRVSPIDRGVPSRWSSHLHCYCCQQLHILSSHVDCFKYSLFTSTISDWNKLLQDVWPKPSIVSFRSVLLKIQGPIKNNVLAMALQQ